NTENGDLLSHQTASTGSVSTEWNVNIGEVYHWKVKVGDPHENATGGVWSFNKIATVRYLVKTDIMHEYTSLITQVNTPVYFSFKVENKV
ncbi:MAG: hypothetical protein ABEI78_00110, partial [Candidatus Nanohaloarchaea archaeon]